MVLYWALRRECFNDNVFYGSQNTLFLGGQKTLKFFDFSVFMRRGGAVSDQRPMHTSMAASYA